MLNQNFSKSTFDPKMLATNFKQKTGYNLFWDDAEELFK